MKKLYVTPRFQTIEFEPNTDVITTSGPESGMEIFETGIKYSDFFGGSGE